MQCTTITPTGCVDSKGALGYSDISSSSSTVSVPGPPWWNCERISYCSGPGTAWGEGPERMHQQYLQPVLLSLFLGYHRTSFNGECLRMYTHKVRYLYIQVHVRACGNLNIYADVKTQYVLKCWNTFLCYAIKNWSNGIATITVSPPSIHASSEVSLGGVVTVLVGGSHLLLFHSGDQLMVARELYGRRYRYSPHCGSNMLWLDNAQIEEGIAIVCSKSTILC